MEFGFYVKVDLVTAKIRRQYLRSMDVARIYGVRLKNVRCVSEYCQPQMVHQ